MPDLKSSQVDIDLYLEPAFEIRWHSPRVPADATSAVFERVLSQHGSILCDDTKCSFRSPLAVPEKARLVFLSPLTANDRTDVDAAVADRSNIGRDYKRRAYLEPVRLTGLDFELRQRA